MRYSMSVLLSGCITTSQGNDQLLIEHRLPAPEVSEVARIGVIVLVQLKTASKPSMLRRIRALHACNMSALHADCAVDALPLGLWTVSTWLC